MCFPLHFKSANAKCGNIFNFLILGRKKVNAENENNINDILSLQTYDCTSKY